MSTRERNIGICTCCQGHKAQENSLAQPKRDRQKET
jgi:hypothetical protein